MKSADNRRKPFSWTVFRYRPMTLLSPLPEPNPSLLPGCRPKVGPGARPGAFCPKHLIGRSGEIKEQRML